MWNRDRWLEVFETLRKNKLRAALSGFTIALGIFIFVTLYGFGNGLKNAFQEFFLDDATNTLGSTLPKPPNLTKGLNHGAISNLKTMI